MSKTRKVKKRTIQGQRPKLMLLDEAQRLDERPNLVEIDRWDPTNWGAGEVKAGEGMPEKFVEPMPRIYDQIVNEADYNPLLELSLYNLSLGHWVEPEPRQPWPSHWTAGSGIDEPPDGWDYA